MEKKLSDYLHLYLSCEVMIEGKIRCVLSGFEQDGQNIFKPVIRELHYKFINKRVNDWYLIKPILRKLSDMTEEENKIHSGKRTIQRATPVHVISVVVETPESFKYLLSIGIDLFGLIEANLAIDYKTIK